MSRRIFNDVGFLLAVLASVLFMSGPSITRADECPGNPVLLGTSLTNQFPLTPRALQNNPTSFGDAAPPSTGDTEGNELNQLFITNDGTTLYIGVTGNTERLDGLENTVLVFIDTGENGGTAILDTAHFTGGSNALRNLDVVVEETDYDGVQLDFAPEYCLAAWNVAGVQNGYLHDLTNPTDAGTALVYGTDFAVNNDNLAGVNDLPSSDPIFQEQNAATAVTGYEFAISLEDLGIDDSSTINVQVLLVGGGGYISNQSLPPLNRTSGNSGGGKSCVGNQFPQGEEPYLVNFADNTPGTGFPGLQNVSYTCDSGRSAPGGTFDGTDIPARYTAPGVGLLAATQNNYTCFGNASPFSPIPTGGAEINRIYSLSDNAKIYIGVTGNIPYFGDNNNSLLIFIDNLQGGGSQTLFTNVLTGGSGALQGMSGASGQNGFTFDDGFAPEYCIMYWRGGATHNARIMSLIFDEHIDNLDFTSDATRHRNPAVNAYFANLTNILGVNDISGDDPIYQQLKAAEGGTGVQFSLRAADLGIDLAGGTANFRMLACIVSGSGYVSNQFLPPLNPTGGAPKADSAAFSDAPLPLAITDDDMPVSDTRPVDMTSADIDRVTDVNAAVHITHADVSQLSVRLRHEDSLREVELVAAGSQSGTEINLTFDSEGAPAVQPSESLRTFNGVNPNGNWTILVTDTVSGDTGQLVSWGLDVTEWEGGNVGCLGQYDENENNLNLSTDPRTPGDQFLNLSMPALNNDAFRPTGFSASGIPAAFYNNPRSTQNNHTCFGDAQEAAIVNLPGSEADQLMIKNTSERLRIGVTGNLEGNANAMILLLDTDAMAGSETLPVMSTPPQAVADMDGLVLDPGFTPDYMVVVQRDNTVGVNEDDYNVFIKNINTNITRTIGSVRRNAIPEEQNPAHLGDATANQNGSELDELFVQNDDTRLYLGITGNLEGNGNAWIIFIETPSSTLGNVLDTNYVGVPTALREISGDHLDAEFSPDFALVMHRSGAVYSAQLVDLHTVSGTPVVTTLTFQNTLGDNVFVGDNTNGLGVSSTSAHDTAPGMNPPDTVQIENARSAQRGVQFAVARSSLQHDMGPVLADEDQLRIGAVLVSNTGFWSNQTLPGLGGAKANLGFPPAMSFIDLDNETTAPGDQFVNYVVAAMGGYDQPDAPFDGSGIPARMGSALATQNNYTGFGNSVLVNPGNANCTQIAFNNENTLGVTGSSASVAEASSAVNGFHFDIDFDDIGLPSVVDPVTGPFTPIKVMAVITGQNGYFSNQLLPPLNRDPPPGDLGTIGTNWSGDLSDEAVAPGIQYLGYTLAPFCGDDPADINGDGEVNMADIDALVGVLLGYNTNPCDVANADVDEANGTNALDIQKYLDLLDFVP